MLGESLGYPKARKGWEKTVLIGGGLELLGALIFITFLPLQGYFVRVVRSAASEEQEPPAFDNWGDLFIDGIKMSLVHLAYVVGPGILLFVGLAVAAFGAFSGLQGSSLGTGLEIVGVLLALASLVAFLLAFYLIPAALANYAYRDDLGSAFDLGTVRRVAFTSDYFVALLLAFVVGITLGLIASFLSILLVGFFLWFYVQVSIYYLIGRGCAKGLDLETGGPAGVEAGSAGAVE